MSDTDQADAIRSRLLALFRDDGLSSAADWGEAQGFAIADARAQYRSDTGSDSIAGHHMRAVAFLAGSYLLEEMAAQRGGDSHAGLEADSVDHGSAAERYGARARRWRDLYNAALGLSDKRRSELKPAGVVVNLYELQDDDGTGGGTGGGGADAA